MAVINSKVDANHPDLAGAIAEHYDAVGRPEQAHSHGTGMTGAIVSHRKLLGIAPNARILAVHAFSTSTRQSPEATTRQIIAGIEWAINKGARIINMSFAGPYDPMIQLAMRNAAAKGVILIAASGNMGAKSPPLYPAADPHVIAVTATDESDTLFAQAVRGPHLAVAAPGVDVMVPAPDDTYQLTTGTSVAAAHVSGVAALLLERHPSVDARTVLEVLTSTARNLNPEGPRRPVRLGPDRPGGRPARTRQQDCRRQVDRDRQAGGAQGRGRKSATAKSAAPKTAAPTPTDRPTRRRPAAAADRPGASSRRDPGSASIAVAARELFAIDFLTDALLSAAGVIRKQLKKAINEPASIRRASRSADSNPLAISNYRSPSPDDTTFLVELFRCNSEAHRWRRRKSHLLPNSNVRCTAARTTVRRNAQARHRSLSCRRRSVQRRSGPAVRRRPGIPDSKDRDAGARGALQRAWRWSTTPRSGSSSASRRTMRSRLRSRSWPARRA